MSFIKSQKTELFWASAATTATRAAFITTISGLGGAADQIDTTTLDDASNKTFVAGLGNPGQVTVGFKLNKGELSHTALLGLKDAGTSVSWGIYSSDAATTPTAVGSVMQSVTGRVCAIFNGYVADVNVDIAGNDIWQGTITIQRSGNVTWTNLSP